MLRLSVIYASVHQNPIMTIMITYDEWEIEMYRYFVSIGIILWPQYQNRSLAEKQKQNNLQKSNYRRNMVMIALEGC